MPHMIQMKVDCRIIPKMVMVSAVAMVVVAVAVDVAVDMVAVIMVATVPEGTTKVALLPPVLQMRRKDELIHRPRVIPTMMLNFSKIT